MGELFGRRAVQALCHSSLGTIGAGSMPKGRQSQAEHDPAADEMLPPWAPEPAGWQLRRFAAPCPPRHRELPAGERGAVPRCRAGERGERLLEGFEGGPAARDELDRLVDTLLDDTRDDLLAGGGAGPVVEDKAEEGPRLRAGEEHTVLEQGCLTPAISLSLPTKPPRAPKRHPDAREGPYDPDGQLKRKPPAIALRRPPVVFVLHPDDESDDAAPPPIHQCASIHSSSVEGSASGSDEGQLASSIEQEASPSEEDSSSAAQTAPRVPKKRRVHGLDKAKADGDVKCESQPGSPPSTSEFR